MIEAGRIFSSAQFKNTEPVKNCPLVTELSFYSEGKLPSAPSDLTLVRTQCDQFDTEGGGLKIVRGEGVYFGRCRITQKPCALWMSRLNVVLDGSESTIQIHPIGPK